MTRLDQATVLRRVERIAEDLRDNVPGSRQVTLTRLDALADDLRKGLHSDDAPDADSETTEWEPPLD